MSCRRSFDIDLAAFLRDPHARQLADFVDHYPRCPWCAAEVRAWTEVRLALAPPHPEPARLLAYRAGALAGAERERVDRHVAGCRSCAEELRALDGFAAVEALARKPRVLASIGSVVRRLLRGSGRIVWHPAFAYGVLLVLLVPLLPLIGKEVRPAPQQIAAPPEPEEMRREDHDLLAREAPPSALPPAGEAAKAQPRAALRESAPAEAPARDATASAASPPEVLVPRRRGRERLLEVPLPADVRGASSVEVRLRDHAGTRELRQRFARPGGDTLTVRVPALWLSRGEYELEVRAADGTAEPASRFAVKVR